jgi:N-acyl-D-amino-acid deacylase
MTSLPAEKFNIKNRGLIKEDYIADIVIFDENEVADMANYTEPHQYAKGFKYVWVNGALTITEGQHNGTRKGMAIRNKN